MTHQREWRPRRPTDAVKTLAWHRRGPYDPTHHVVDGVVWRTSRPGGDPATLRLAVHPREGVVAAQAWGPGAEAALDMLPAWLGEHDDSEDFQPAHDVVAQAWRRMQVVRLSRTGLVMEALVPAVLEQKVTGIEAYRGWVALLNRYGDAAPGPAPGILRVVPEPRAWAAIPSWGWHQAGVTPERARTIVRASRVADSLERLAALPSDEADRRLQSLPGIGVWTSAEIRQRSHGDPDAISVGDANLPHHVAFALASERRATDERMLELLEPYAGHRHRAATLIAMYTPRPPRRAPRAPLRDYRRM